MNLSQNRVGRPCHQKVRKGGSYKTYGPEGLKRALRMVHKGTSVCVASSRCCNAQVDNQGRIQEVYCAILFNRGIFQYPGENFTCRSVIQRGRDNGGQVFSLAADEWDTFLQQSNIK